jgi:glycosyltransferase involved in cell wall biosynthesis
MQLTPTIATDEDDVPRPRTADATISIVIPAHNEERVIGDVLRDLGEHKPPGVIEIIVVDDGSSDRTAQIATEAGVRVLRHPNNRGYGAALKTGIRAATGAYVLTMDADGQHRLEDVARLCEATRSAEPPECVIGQRTALVHSPLWRMPGKWLLRAMAQFLTRRKIPDLNSGLRLMRRDVALRYINLCPQGFSFSTTITMALLSRGYGVEFIPIEVKRRVGKSTVSVRTGFDVILLVLRLATLFNPLRIFLPASFLCVLAGVGWGARYAIAGQGVTVASMLAILTGVLLFALGLVCDQVAQLRLERYE